MEENLYPVYFNRATKHLEYYMVYPISQHLADVTASVMMCRDGYRPGSSTVEAICKNDLYETAARADHIVIANLQVIVAAYHYAHIEQLEYV